ncbi:M20/M25/M40 family metallo-hydrolase [Propionibacterium sp. oral taxon 192]|uniref:M20/M25/M40 family metallo-hydrolase n=1 Tax=Propionibacterium sp. oral taxon 192 TaxID=671222 RepID=UPI001E5D2D31|nr:M20/M25/M40 family metallo-hydrolase [Propionibacterium sp. oral taxon 192]
MNRPTRARLPTGMRSVVDVESIAAEAVRITRELIRFDTSNHGHDHPGQDTQAAGYVIDLLRGVGLEPQVFEPDPGRVSVIVRISGADHQRDGLVLHGHLDVVPAVAQEWTHDPFSGEIHDGQIWGRGAVDMKSMDAMILANLLHIAREKIVPPRDIVFAFFADEEQGGTWGAAWCVENHPELFAGCTEAISEVGGYSITLPTRDGNGSRRAYLLQTAERGFAWARLRATGRPGHGSLPNNANAIVRLAEAITRINDHEWDREFVASVDALFSGIHRITGIDAHTDLPTVLDMMPGARSFVEGSLRDTVNLTRLDAGFKNNVVPAEAMAHIDCRFLPGHRDAMMRTVRELAGEHVEVIVDQQVDPLDSPRQVPLVAAMAEAIAAEDPGAELLPYCLSASTDNKHLARLGIAGYGFAPLQLPPDLAFAELFHGIDERVPVTAVEFGTRVLHRLLSIC